MKRLVALLCLLAVPALAQTPTPPPAPAPLAIGAETTFRFTKGVAHFFRLVPPARGALRVEVLASPAGHNPPWWHWLDESGKELRGYEADIAVAAGTPVVLEVRSDGWDIQEYTSPEPVRIKVGFRPRSADDSQGLTFDAPRPLAFDQEASFTFFVRGEPRFFRLVPPAQGSMRREFLAAPGGHDPPWVHWLDESGKELRGNEADIAVAGGAPVILEVRSDGWNIQEYTSPQPVRLKVAFTPRSADDSQGLTFDAPRPLAFDQEASFTFFVRGEPRFFRLMPPAQGSMRREFLAAPGGHDPPWVHWLDESGKELRGNEADVAVAGGAPVILEVRSDGWNLREYASPDPVTIKVGFRPRSADDSQGLTFDAPRPLAFDQEASFTFFVRGEPRFFRLVPPTQGSMRLAFLAAPGGHDPPWVHWLDESGKELRGNEADIAVAGGAPVILEVRSDGWNVREYASPDPVKIKVGFRPRTSSDANGRTLAAPQALAFDEETQFSFFVRGEPHFFRLVPPLTGALKLDILASPAGHDPPWWHWLDEAGNELRGREADIAVAGGTPVILEVRSDSWNVREYASPDPVKLKVGFRPRSAEDSVALALDKPRAIAIDEEARFTFFVRGEARYFRLVPPGEGALKVEILASPAQHDPPWWRWLDAAGKEIAPAGETPKVAPGTALILEVRSDSWDQRDYTSPDPVRLRVRLPSWQRVWPKR